MGASRAASALLGVWAVAAACSTFSTSDDSSPDAGTDASDGAAPSDAPAPPPPTCSATDSDPLNCGACGHDCLGGACNAGVCQPVVVATVPDPIGDVALDTGHVLWMTWGDASGKAGSLRACPKPGCNGAVPTVVDGPEPTASVHSDGTTAYATFVNGAAKTVRVEPGLSITAFATAHTFARVHALSDGAYLMAYGEPADGGGLTRTIYRSTSPSAVAERIAAYDNYDLSNDNADQFVVSDSHVYLGSHSAPAIIACTKSDCSTWQTVVNDTNVGYVQSMTRDAKNLYWVGAFAWNVYACPLDTFPCTPMEVLGTAVLGSAQARTVTFGGGLLVVTTDTDVFACDPTSCSTTAKKIAHEDAIDLQLRLETHNTAADATAIYWSAEDRPDGAPTTHRLMMIAR